MKKQQQRVFLPVVQLKLQNQKQSQKVAVLSLSFFILLILCVLPVCLAEDNFPAIGIVKKDNVNLRSGPSTNYESLYKFGRDERIEIIGEKFGWYKVKFAKGTSCFINEQFVRLSNREGSGDILNSISGYNNTDSDKGTVNSDNVNVRASPALNATIITQLNKNSKVQILGKNNDWYRIAAPDGCFGYVVKELVRIMPAKEALEGSISKEASNLINPTLIQDVVHDKEDPGFLAFTGSIAPLGRIINCPATHKLVDNNKIICYLKSAGRVNLNNYINLTVKIQGLAEAKDYKRRKVVIVEEVVTIE